MRGKKAATLEAAAEKEMGTAEVPIFLAMVGSLDLGSNQGIR